MKFNILLKDPDGVDDSIKEAVRKAVYKELAIDESLGIVLSNEEVKVVIDLKEQEIYDSPVFKKYFMFREYVKLEIDTDNNTCIIVPIKD